MAYTIKMEAEYSPQEIVYLITDPEQRSRMVTGYKIEPGLLLYILICGIQISYHYEFEITREKSINI